jgi:hypothetical protein
LRGERIEAVGESFDKQAHGGGVSRRLGAALSRSLTQALDAMFRYSYGVFTQGQQSFHWTPVVFLQAMAGLYSILQDLQKEL